MSSTNKIIKSLLFILGFSFIPLSGFSNPANLQILGLSNTNPALGSTISVTISFCDDTAWASNRVSLIAGIVAGSVSGFSACPAANQYYVVDAGIPGFIANGPGLYDPGTGSTAGVSLQVYPSYTNNGTPSCPAGSVTTVWSIYIDGSYLNGGSTYSFVVGAAEDYVNCTNASTYASTTFMIQPPPPGATINKRAEAVTTAPGSLVLFSMDYTFVNTTGVTITDTVPANSTVYQMGPLGTQNGNALTWIVYNGVATAQQKGTVWFLAQVNPGTADGTIITNTATISAAGASGAGSTASTTVKVPHLTLTKSQTASSLPSGGTQTYSLSWSADGQSLQWYDSYDNSAGIPTGFDGSSYTDYPNGGQTGAWTLTADPNGGQFIQTNGGGQYPALIRSTSLNTCSNYTVEGDLYVDSNNVPNEDGTMVVGYNGQTGANTQAYMVGISVDPGPFHLFLQKTVNGTAAWPTGDNGFNVQFNTWYTVKVQIVAAGTSNNISVKGWPRGTAEPAGWNFTYVDTTPPPCNPVSVYVGWQADQQINRYDNLKVFAPGPVVNSAVTDVVPAGMTFTSFGPVDTGTTTNFNVGTSTLSWANPTTLFGQPLPLTWWGTVSCPGPISNQFTMAALGAAVATSNTVNTTLSSCTTPSPTLSNTPSPTATNSPTPTPTNTPTLSPTPTITNTLTTTPTSSPTLTPTVTYTPTISPTPTATPAGLHVWPNPFDPKYAVGGTLKAYQVPMGSTMSFYTVSGELVRTASESGGMILWDGRNNNAAMVSTGTYYYVIQNNSKVLLTGKVLVLIEQ